MKITLLLINLDRLPHRPFAVQGVSGKIYGHANYDRAIGGHVFAMPLEDFKTAGSDIVRAGVRPLSMWRVTDVLVESEELNEAKLAEELDKLQAEVALTKAFATDLQSQLDASVAALEKRTAERDAAIRAMLNGAATRQENIVRLEVPSTPAESGPSQGDPAAAEQAENPVQSSAPVESTETPVNTGSEIVAVATDSENNDKGLRKHTREELDKIAAGKKGFRNLRKMAMTAKIPGADKLTDPEDLIKLLLELPADEAPAAELTEEDLTEQPAADSQAQG